MTRPRLPTDHPEVTGQMDTPDQVVTRGPFAARANGRTSAHVGQVWGWLFAVQAVIILLLALVGWTYLFHAAVRWLLPLLGSQP